MFRLSGRREPVHVLENLQEIAHETHLLRTFQDTKSSREREIPAQCNSPSNLLIDQKHIYPQCFR